MDREKAVLAGFSLVFADNGKGSAELCTEIVDIDSKELLGFFKEEDWVIINAAMNAVRRISSKVQREIHNEINAVRSA